MQVYGRSDVGSVRTNNEDSLLIADATTAQPLAVGELESASLGDRQMLLAVSDGMGGENAGEVASAMTLDAIDADGVHLGGWIVPSPMLMRDAVLARTARVGAFEGALVEFADDTADGLHSGTLNAAAGAIDRFVANAARRLGAAPSIVATGGGADALVPLVANVELRRDIVLDGLALWANADGAADSRRGER